MSVRPRDSFRFACLPIVISRRLRGYGNMHLRVDQEQYGILMKGERVVCLYIALLCMIMVQLLGKLQSVLG